MKVIEEIFNKPIAAFKKVRSIKDKLAGAQSISNEIATYAASTEQKENAATAKLFAEPSLENFKLLCAAHSERVSAMYCLTRVISSLGRLQVDELTDSDEAVETLLEACEAYANELNGRIEQICNDSRALADRAGIDFVEPPAVQTLRTEAQNAKDAAEACRRKLNGVDVLDLWQKVSPMIRINATRPK